MVLPLAGNAEILARVAFLPETGSGKNRPAGNVARQAGGFESMQPEALEGKINDERQSRCHVALPRIRLADPIAKARRLGNAATDIRQADAANQGFVKGKDEKIVGLVGAPVLDVTGHPRTKIRAAQRIGGPAWLPG